MPKKDKVIRIALILFSALQIVFTCVIPLDAFSLRCGHAMLLLCFGFLKKPDHKGLILCGAALLAFAYLLISYPRLSATGGRMTTPDYVFSGAALVILFIGAYQVNRGLAVLAGAFLLYCFVGPWIPGALSHNGFALTRVLRHLFCGTQGIFGAPLGVSATYLFLFMLFGAFLKASGFSAFIYDLSMALFGRSAGGAAKVSVAASALMGMINGSAVANVATTGTITIPTMKKSGFSGRFAAAVEAAASTGGQFTPPVMGAAAFLMAEWLGLPYQTVMLAAIGPALVYYGSIFASVHFEAKRIGLTGLPPEALPSAKAVLRRGGHLLIPVALLIGLMLAGFTPLFSAVCAIPATVLSAALRKETRMSFCAILDALAEGARSAVSVGIICILVGVISGVVSLTGLGLNFAGLLISAAGAGRLWLGVILAAVMCLILGMGVPGVAAYVIVGSIAAPALIDMGASPLSAHFFTLIYACLANLTPPVAVSAYVAAGIADAKPSETGWTAVRLAAAGFLLPLFLMNSPLLGGAPILVIRAAITALLGGIALAKGLAGGAALWRRALLILAAPLLMDAGMLTDGIGAALLLISLFDWRKHG